MQASTAQRWLEVVLRAVGFASWMAVGSPSWRLLISSPSSVGSGHPVLWTGFYVGFAIAFLLATQPTLPRSRRRALLVAQSLLAVALATLGMPHFEGALLAVVAAQTPMLVSLPYALLWVLAQTGPLAMIILPSHHALGTLKAVGEYLAFSTFAVAILEIREREARARREVLQLHGELLATQHLLADSARLTERGRIAGELHDLVGHHLAALGLQLEIARNAEGERASKAVTDAHAIAQSMTQDVRAVVAPLRDEGVVDLTAALTLLANGLPNPPVHIEFDRQLRFHDPMRAHALLRCVQECVTNALKYAGATRISVDIRQDGDGVSVVASDDGQGSDAVRPGGGLQAMRQRIEGLGGSVDVRSIPGHGFTVRATVPVETASSTSGNAHAKVDALESP